MQYALQSLLNIRTRREDTARGEVTVARHHLHQAQNDLNDRKEELRLYESTKDQRRNRLYSTIIGRIVNMNDLDLVRQGIARIDEEGNLRAHNVQCAQDKVVTCEEALDHARQGLIVATKNRMKLDEHRVHWLKEETAQADYRQEIELEDFTGKKTQDDRDA